jgi:hypothetical protein
VGSTTAAATHLLGDFHDLNHVNLLEFAPPVGKRVHHQSAPQQERIIFYGVPHP